jgi:hypothetical protein
MSTSESDNSPEDGSGIGSEPDTDTSTKKIKKKANRKNIQIKQSHFKLLFERHCSFIKTIDNIKRASEHERAAQRGDWRADKVRRERTTGTRFEGDSDDNWN